MEEIKNRFAIPFSEYISKYNSKFTIVITKNQYAIEIGGFIHEQMVADLMRRTRPDIKTDSWGRALDEEEAYENSSIIAMGFPGYIGIELPRKEPLSIEQYMYLRDILLEIKKYNDNNHERGFGTDYLLVMINGDIAKVNPLYNQNNILEIIEELKKCVVEELNPPSNEIIIGIDFNKNKRSIEELNTNLDEQNNKGRTI